MEIKYSVTGQDRKRLVGAISSHLNEKTSYLGAPTFAYEIGNYHIDKEGTVTGPDNIELVAALREAGFDSAGKILLDCHKVDEPSEPKPRRKGILDMLTEELNDNGIPCERMHSEPTIIDNAGREHSLNGQFAAKTEYGEQAAADKLTVEVPIKGFTPLALQNLRQMVDAKADLLKKALGCDNLLIDVNTTEETLLFPWFTLADPAESAYYVQFVYALCKTAKEKKRVTAKPAATDNEKFSLRVWLISLGMVGAEYKKARSLLLKNMDGNSAFRSGSNPKTEVQGDE